MDFKTLLDLITTTFIVAAAVFALLQLRHVHRQRARESALQMLHSFQTPEFLTAVNIVFELPEGLSKQEIDARLGDKITSLLVMFGTFESLGILVYRRDMDIRLVEDFLSGILILSGRKLKNYLEEVRTLSNRQTYYEWCQWLIEQVEKRERRTPATPAYIAFRGWED
jgi:hypothetical protein